MALSWVDGQPVNIALNWLHIQSIIPVREDVELVQVKLTILTRSEAVLESYVDNISLQRSLTKEKLFGSEIVTIPLPAMTEAAEIPVFGAVRDAQVVAVHLVPTETVAGNETQPQLRIVNKETGVVICTLTFTPGVTAEAYKVRDFGPVDPVASELREGESVSLQKDAFALPQSLLILEWEVR